MKLEKLLREFMKLGYVEKPCGPSNEIDTLLDTFIIGREKKSGYLIYYLFSGASLEIPWKWIDLFGQFFVHSYHRIINGGVEIEDSLDEFIFKMTKLQQNFMTKKKILETVGDICELGTKEFREKVAPFPPIEFQSLSKQVEI